MATPVVCALLGINLLVFAVMALKGVPVLHPNANQLLHWGANFGPLSLDGQWWRVLTCMFVHIGIVHLALNMWALWEIGVLAEHLYGPRTFLVVYLLSGLAGSIASLARNPMVVSAGASGAIFGIAGALIATLHFGKLPVETKALRASLVSLLVFAGYNLAYGFLKGNIDNGAHVGGLLSGLLLGTVLSRDFLGGGWDWNIRRALFPIFAVVLIACGLAVRHTHMPVVRVRNAENLLAKGDAKSAIRELTDLTRRRPQFAPAWLLLGNAYVRTGQISLAEPALLQAAQLSPKDTASRAQLAMVYIRTGQYEKARAVLQQMTEIDPRDPDAYINLGVALNELGRGEEAVTALRRAVSLNPKQPLAYYNLGLTSMKLKRYDDAVAAFTQMTRLAPRDADSWIWLANAYEAKGLSREADAAYAKAYQLRTQRMRQ